MQLNLGIIKEGKVPADSRVPLSPNTCRQIMQENPDVQIKVQSSDVRCFKDEEYINAGIDVVANVDDCNILLGVKEVPIDLLVPNKTYFFFSHTIKEQVYNRKLLKAIIQKKIHLIDYEALKDNSGKRLIAFGKFAGMVGAHNGVLTYGKRSKTFDLKPMYKCHDYEEAKNIYNNLKLPPFKVVVTGGGRVATGAVNVLKDMGISQVSPNDFLQNEYDRAVFTQLHCKDYVVRKDGKTLEIQDFYSNPSKYESAFAPYTKLADMMINGIYWDNDAPAFFTKEEMKKDDFRICVISDVTCDIAPQSSIPSTLYATTIDKPVFGYDPVSEKETDAYQAHTIDITSIDNLPNEMPRDASKSFGIQFMKYILPALKKDNHPIIEGASVTKAGDLCPKFEYLRNYLEGI